jgi:hypothetical protein
MNRREMRALDLSHGGWGQVGSASMTRYSKAKTDLRRGRRKCEAGCPNRNTHMGMANGVALMSGCEFHVAAWVRASDEQMQVEAPESFDRSAE